MIEDTAIKLRAKRRKEGGRITHLLVGIRRGSRGVVGRQGWVWKRRDHRRAVQESEQLSLSRAAPSLPVVITLEEWRRYAEKGPISSGQLERAYSELDLDRGFLGGTLHEKHQIGDSADPFGVDDDSACQTPE